MPNYYKPTEVDIRWMKQNVSMLSIGGIWIYKGLPIMFKKTAEDTMALIIADETYEDIREQVLRNKLVMASAGIKFVDQRTRL